MGKYRSLAKKEDYMFQNTRCLILHDYDAGAVDGAYDFIKDWLYSRNNLNSNTVKPYSLGTKFPIQVSSEEELLNGYDCLSWKMFLEYNIIILWMTFYVIK